MTDHSQQKDIQDEQKSIYDIVLGAQVKSIEGIKIWNVL